MPLVVQHQLRAVYFQRYFVAGRGLISNAPDDIEPHQRAVGYVDRILRGEKLGDLPVQVPTEYRLVINFKRAKIP
jgi:putative ABC transport system substrate-binding protein